MVEGLYKKALVVGIIVLFIGVVVQPALANTMENHPPYAPSNYSCGEEPLPLIVNLSWDGGDPDPGDSVYYDVYFDNVYPSQKIATVGPYPWNQTRIEYGPVELEEYTTYYMVIVAYDNHGAYVQGPIYNFHTGGDTTPPEVELTFIVVMGWGYVFIANCSDNSGIDRVEFTFDGGINSVDMYEPYEWAIPYEEAKNGIVCAIAYDYAGNNGSDCVNLRSRNIENYEIEPVDDYEEIITWIHGDCTLVTRIGFYRFEPIHIYTDWYYYSFEIIGLKKPLGSNDSFFRERPSNVNAPIFYGWVTNPFSGVIRVNGIAFGNIEWS